MNGSNVRSAPPLEAFGALVRQVRLKKGLTQQRAARGAGVSRKQWALLESGQNVSAVFIQKVASFLELQEVPLGGVLRGVVGQLGIDATVLVHAADALDEIVARFTEQLRALAFDNAVLPAARTDHADAIAEFVAGVARRSDAYERLATAIADLASTRAPRGSSVSNSSPKRTARVRKRNA